MAAHNWRFEWVSQKCKIASALARGEAGGSYSEAVILVCAVLNALAAEVWPGTRIDKARFVELLVRLGSLPHEPQTISVPLLVRHLEATSPANAALLRKNFLDFSKTRVVTGLEIDSTESELISLCPGLTPTVVRKYSYACLLYEEVRSSYAHEYKPGEKADSWPMTMASGQSVSYVNRLLTTDTYEAIETIRLVHFHIEWLTKLAEDLALYIDGISTTLPYPLPSKWWKDGSP
jgi:hypothetical protein